MPNAEQRGWGSPESRGYSERLVKITADGTSYRVRKEVAPLFQGFLNELVASGYSLDEVEDDWSYSNRDIRGRPGVKSNHAWGLAIDINATKNPMHRTLVTDMPVELVQYLIGVYALDWGGNYDGRKDAMHFEFIGSPGQASVAVANLRIKDSFPREKELRMEPEVKAYLQQINSNSKHALSAAEKAYKDTQALLKDVAALQADVKKLTESDK